MHQHSSVTLNPHISTTYESVVSLRNSVCAWSLQPRVRRVISTRIHVIMSSGQSSVRHLKCRDASLWSCRCRSDLWINWYRRSSFEVCIVVISCSAWLISPTVSNVVDCCIVVRMGVWITTCYINIVKRCWTQIT